MRMATINNVIVTFHIFLHPTAMIEILYHGLLFLLARIILFALDEMDVAHMNLFQWRYTFWAWDVKNLEKCVTWPYWHITYTSPHPTPNQRETNIYIFIYNSCSHVHKSCFHTIADSALILETGCRYPLCLCLENELCDTNYHPVRQLEGNWSLWLPCTYCILQVPLFHVTTNHESEDMDGENPF